MMSQPHLLVRVRAQVQAYLNGYTQAPVILQEIDSHNMS
jgi:hypothetical protein